MHIFLICPHFSNTLSLDKTAQLIHFKHLAPNKKNPSERASRLVHITLYTAIMMKHFFLCITCTDISFFFFNQILKFKNIFVSIRIDLKYLSIANLLNPCRQKCTDIKIQCNSFCGRFSI